jgi:beta-lactamase class D
MRKELLTIVVFSLLRAGLAYAKPETVFVLRDLDSARERVDNEKLADTSFLPYSTFKVPNTLIGLETGVIPDEKFALKWDGKKYPIEAWNHDQDLASALRESVVWFYQEVARRIGPARMSEWLHELRYGNEKSTPAIDRFWLDGGDARITPRQEAEFFARMAKRELPVSAAHVALLRRLLTLRTDGGCVLEGKSGTGPQNGKELGWLVGFFDTPVHHYAYAYLTIDDHAPTREERTNLVVGRLKASGVYVGCSTAR